nr:flavin reductase family protein [Burkholderiaceae bacterium]
MSGADAAAQRALRDVLGTFATGVTVITTLARPERRPIGLTVNSFSSVSLDPPLALWSISERSPSVEHFGVGRGHVIHILSQQQAA